MEKRWENMHFDRLRKTIFTAFVDNVSLRVSWKDLKAFFNQFGVVVDIYLPRVSRNRITRYAFVRYRYRVELNRAIDMGQNRRLDGRTLSIKEADKPKENSYRTGERPTRIWQEMGVGNGRRTFRECTMRATIIETETIDIDLKTFSVIEKKLEELRPSNSQESQQADGIRAGSTVHGMDMTHVRKMRVEIKHGEDQPDMALENRTNMTRQIEGSSSQGHRSQNEGDP
ncbi:RNA recognition motif domain - like 10 [Theobroma cacao]|nr:RNA recognition motif domain - like 10 [Theobroma cacao]